MSSASFPYLKALAYARALYEEADSIAEKYRTFQTVQSDALKTWEGPHADEMRKERIKEEEMDIVVVAVKNMRLEAQTWAEEWAENANRYNGLEYNKTQYDTSIGFRQKLRIERADPVAPPRPPTFSSGPVFAKYKRVHNQDSFQIGLLESGETWELTLTLLPGRNPPYR